VNEALNALKVGRSTVRADRLKDWSRAGWTAVARVDMASGYMARDVEQTIIFHWRKVLCLGWACGPDDMGELHGHSETVPLDRVNIGEVIAMMYRVASEITLCKQDAA
jgi:hypothetical protein